MDGGERPDAAAGKREAARSFEDLMVWQKAHRFVLRVYQLTDSFPRHELFGLTAQLRRAAVSVAANIAEGFGKRGRPDKARFLNTAQGSLQECHYYLILARDLQYGETASTMAHLDEVRRLLAAYATAVLASAR